MLISVNQVSPNRCQWMQSQSGSTSALAHWGRVTHICVGKLANIGSDNSLSPGRRQAIIWTNAGISLIGLFGTNFNEILIGIQIFSFKKMHLKMSSPKWRPFCLSLNELVMVYSLMTSSQHPNNCWLIISEAFTPGQCHRKCLRFLSLLWLSKWRI